MTAQTEILERNALQRAKSIFEKLRNGESLTRNERAWIIYRRCAKRGRGRTMWFPALDILAKKYGFKDMFSFTPRKFFLSRSKAGYQIRVEKTVRAIFERLSKTGKLGKPDGLTISQIRMGKAGKNRRKWYPVLDEIASEYGFQGIFDEGLGTRQRKQHALEVFSLIKAGKPLSVSQKRWVCGVRSRQDSYTLSLAEKHGLTSFFRKFDSLKETEARAYLVFGRALKAGRLPMRSLGQNNTQEYRDASWINNLRLRGKKGLSKRSIRLVDQIAREHGFHDIFSSQYTRMVSEAERIFKKFKKKGPSRIGNPKDYALLSRLRFICRSKKTKYWKEIKKLSEKYGYRIKDTPLVAYGPSRAKQIFLKCHRSGRLPIPEEKSDYGWLKRLQYVKSGTVPGKWIPEYDEIASKYGFPNAFDKELAKEKYGFGENRTKNKNNIQRAKEIFARCQKLGHLPLRNGDEQEVADYRWVALWRSKKRKNVRWNPKLEEIAASFGFPNVFGNQKSTAILERAKEFFRNYQEKGRLPIREEASDYGWLVRWRMAKKRNRGWHPEFEEIAAAHGFPKAFESQKRHVVRVVKGEKRFGTILDKAEMFFEEYRAKGRLPINHYTARFERKDYYWLLRWRKEKRNNTKVWHPELTEIAAKYGFPNAFEEQ